MSHWSRVTHRESGFGCPEGVQGRLGRLSSPMVCRGCGLFGPVWRAIWALVAIP